MMLIMINMHHQSLDLDLDLVIWYLLGICLPVGENWKMMSTGIKQIMKCVDLHVEVELDV